MEDFQQLHEYAILSYLGLPAGYSPLPSSDPVAFLQCHLHHLPPHLQSHFSLITSPTQRTQIVSVRNRRLKYALSAPGELSFASARSTWPHLWPGREKLGQEEGRDEKEWVEKQFLQGQKGHVGKLGTLLGDYEEEREAQRVRSIRRERASVAVHSLRGRFFSEEEMDTDADEAHNPEPLEDMKADFERLVREKFIYGLLDYIDYDSVDWNEALDTQDREAEERWFDTEDPEE